MNIYVRRDFELLGPFFIGEVQDLLAKGNLSPTDDACIEGSEENWKPLREVVLTASRSAVPANISLSQPAARSTNPIDSTDQSGNIEGVETFKSMPKGQISRLASVGKAIGSWLLGAG